MEDEVGRCYMLRRKGVKAGSEVLIELTLNRKIFQIGTACLKAPSDPGTYTLLEELSVEMNHTGWKWMKEGTND